MISRRPFDPKRFQARRQEMKQFDIRRGLACGAQAPPPEQLVMHKPLRQIRGGGLDNVDGGLGREFEICSRDNPRHTVPEPTVR